MSKKRKWVAKHRKWQVKKFGIDAVMRKRKAYERYIKSAEWQAVRRMALDHFKRKCFLCESVFDLEVHHLNYKNFGFESIEDVVVLCANCHAREHAKPKTKKLRKHIHWTPETA